jgi:hypothetical protein
VSVARCKAENIPAVRNRSLKNLVPQNTVVVFFARRQSDVLEAKARAKKK